MNPVSIIEKAAASGLHLAANADYLEWECNNEPSTELLGFLRDHKAGVLIELERLQWLWLGCVARLLQSTPEHLLQNKLVEPVDLRELWHTEPHHAAKLIRSCHQPGQYQYKNGGADFEG